MISNSKPKRPKVGSEIARHLAPQNLSPLRRAMKKQLVTLKQANSSRKMHGDQILREFAHVKPQGSLAVAKR